MYLILSFTLRLDPSAVLPSATYRTSRGWSQISSLLLPRHPDQLALTYLKGGGDLCRARISPSHVLRHHAHGARLLDLRHA